MVSAEAISQRLHLHFFFPEGEKGSRFKVDNSTIQKSVQKKGDCWEAGGGERPAITANNRRRK